MDHELTAKWHELDKVQVGLKDVVVLHPDLAPIQRQIGDLVDLTTEAKTNLVAAINEVARTGGGAGSMGLRVADGYVQYSTDGGSTWQNLIAVADLKGDTGAPGKDGAGMDITGATVGQIAKITAVDASGVPTAWAPVDMPSGGGENFELIMDDTVPANATGYANDKDINGESFALREWVLILWTPAHTDNDHGNVGRGAGFIPASRWGVNEFKVTDTVKKSDGIGRYDMLHIKVVSGYQMQLLHTRSQNASTAFGVMQQDVAAGAVPISFKTDATALFELTNTVGYATCVKIVGYSNEYVPAGTHIKLYGKRVKS